MARWTLPSTVLTQTSPGVEQAALAPPVTRGWRSQPASRTIWKEASPSLRTTVPGRTCRRAQHPISRLRKPCTGVIPSFCGWSLAFTWAVATKGFMRAPPRASSAPIGFVEFDVSGQRLTVVALAHGLHQLVLEQPSTKCAVAAWCWPGRCQR